MSKRYDNKREQIEKLVDAILDLPASKVESSDHLRKLHDTANENILAIKNLQGLPEDEENQHEAPKLDELMVIHIILKKLSQDTIMHYECQLANNRDSGSLTL